jgi:DNA polymerase III gamma/tau subunit
MAQRLDAVAKREGIKLEAGVSKYIARLSDGSLRDGLGNLEQVSIFSNGDVTMSAVSEFFGLPEKRITYEIVDMMAAGNISGMMLNINDLIMSCVQPREILFEISNVLRNIYMVINCGRNAKLVDINDDEMDLVERLSKRISAVTLQKMVESLRNTERMVAVHINERWVVESALVHCAMIIQEAQSSLKK